MRSSIALLPFFLFACGDGSSEESPVLVTYTPDVAVSAFATAGPVSISAAFGDAVGTLLPESVIVTASGRGLDVTLTRQKDFYTQELTNRFGGSLDLANPVDTDEIVVTVTLGDETAIATATMPAPFDIDSALATGNDVMLAWSPSNIGGMSWEVNPRQASNHTCAVFGYPADRTIEDTGTITVNTTNISAMGMGCSWGLELRRTRLGSQDGFAADGRVVALQRRARP